MRYGDVVPANEFERMITVFIMLFGSCIFASGPGGGPKGYFGSWTDGRLVEESKDIAHRCTECSERSETRHPLFLQIHGFSCECDDVMHFLFISKIIFQFSWVAQDPVRGSARTYARLTFLRYGTQGEEDKQSGRMELPG